MEYRVISGDGHIDVKWLPHDLFVANVPASWRDRVPQVIETDRGKRWCAEGNDLSSSPFGEFVASMEPPKRGVSRHIDRLYEVGFYDGDLHPTTPELRIRDQDIDGVDAEVIYGILGMGGLLEDRDLVELVYETYNAWVADFCKTGPERLVGLACIPNDDPESAAAGLRRAAKLGLKGGGLRGVHCGEAHLAQGLGPAVGGGR